MAGLSAAAMLAGGAMAQRGAALPDECRERSLELCRGETGGAMRACVRRILPELSDTCRKAVSARAAGQPLPEGMREVSYGADQRQRLDLMTVAGGRAPILVFIHGGGWAIGDKRMGAGAKAAWAAGQGWAFASVNYRLVPQARVEQQAADIAAAIAWLRANAAREGIDGSRIVLMGHSAGAHLAALVASDPTYLAAAGVPLGAVKGVVLLDGAGYDVVAQANHPRNMVRPMYEAAFGTDPARQAALSPTRHGAAPNAKRWLILPIAQRADSVAQSNGLAQALGRGGSDARVVPVSGQTHASINRSLGERTNPATFEVERFLAAIR